ncbi:DUF305 domain-containing protein [Nocardioides sp. HDW12B]|uniref:DUF305 domain-containing protein n=1 Tax=Nocardioides sp. HDW12B TaxID=2714939 RepID=UPI00140C050F|nr:DUF305 domain-containing protein [Nocardioides sp. HDW12B]QIK68203.1 DUF305 domain-containing protein [Nocardioides sp. HDW12B]
MSDGSRRRPFLVAGLIVLVAAALAGALLLGSVLTRPDTPAADSVDAGFSRDMRAHHSQAVQMSFLVREATDDADVDQLALDILLTQQQQVGQMYSWLEQWGLPQSSSADRMAWMGHSSDMDMGGGEMSAMPGGMPGMASNADLQALEGARGERASRIFLQLMIPHHEAGVEMADYAVEHAETEQVRQLAESISVAQQSELTVLNDLLDERGGPVTLS